MQCKVSMVMPCYNKVKYIGEMFDSILAQDWDNIELILVNDGSTDGTREVIGEYEPKFHARGFGVLIIDQENAGVCASAKAGLERMTGEYVCLVDSDDELDPKYVSTMAGWLGEHNEYDYCICDAALYIGRGESKQFKPFCPSNISEREPNYTERYLLTDIRSEVWVYLARTDYIKKCRVIETYYTDTKGSHEPGYIIPITSNRGKYKYFPLPLYHFNVGDIGHSHHERFEQAQRFCDEYYRLCKIAIEKLPEAEISFKQKKFLADVALFAKHIRLCRHAIGLADGKNYINQTLKELLDFTNLFFLIDPPISKSSCIGREVILFSAIKNTLLGRKLPNGLDLPQGKIIGYGALGQAAAQLLPILKGTTIEPTELWDTAGDGSIAKKPDFSSLNPNDLVLVFPLAEQVLNQIKTSTTCHVMSNLDIQNYLSIELFKNIQLSGVDMQNNYGQKKVKMLVVYTTFRVCGGVERFLLNFFEVFPQDKYQIDLLLFDDIQDEAKMFDMIPENINILPMLKQFSKWSPELMEELKNSGKAEMAEVRNFINDRNLNQYYDKQPMGFIHEENWKLLKKICPDYAGYDIAVAFTSTLPLKIVAEKVSAAKKVVFLHLDIKACIETKLIDESFFNCEKTYYEQMDGIVCIANQNAATFCEYFPSLSEKVKVLININNQNLLSKQAAEFYPAQYQSDKFNILTVARIHPQKGIDLLLKSARKLKDLGVDFRWFILGNDQGGAYSKECHEMRNSLGIEEDVVFLGSHPNPFPYYKNCELYVQTSLFEGRPLSIEEAMSLNCSILTTDFSSAREQIKDGMNGRICSIDSNSVATAILELYNNEQERKKLADGNTKYYGNTGAEKYLEYFC